MSDWKSDWERERREQSERWKRVAMVIVDIITAGAIGAAAIISLNSTTFAIVLFVLALVFRGIAWLISQIEIV